MYAVCGSISKLLVFLETAHREQFTFSSCLCCFNDELCPHPGLRQTLLKPKQTSVVLEQAGGYNSAKPRLSNARLSVRHQAVMTKQFVWLPNEILALIYTNSLRVPPLPLSLYPFIHLSISNYQATQEDVKKETEGMSRGEERREVTGEVCLLMRWIRLGKQ